MTGWRGDRVGMTNVLVTFASKHGSTAEIADAIAEVLCECGLEVHCVEARDVESLDGYDAVVLGSAVYIRRWRREARKFLKRFGPELERRPFWVFSSGPVGDPSNDNLDWTEPPATIAQATRLGAREHVVFGGRSLSRGIPEPLRDRRDWKEIADWARHIAADLPVHA
jgi:menaquinone-dependent protoporphyrinogen oxidase